MTHQLGQNSRNNMAFEKAGLLWFNNNNNKFYLKFYQEENSQWDQICRPRPLAQQEDQALSNKMRRKYNSKDNNIKLFTKVEVNNHHFQQHWGE